MKLLQINPVWRTTTSTGRIMRELAEITTKAGWENFVAYSAGRDPLPPKGYPATPIPLGNRLSVAGHLLATRLFDRHGLASARATQRFVNEVDKIKPDVIHIHNIHGYFLNYKILFDYLTHACIPVIWTVHDCWMLTGHCYHYSAKKCDRWITGCHDCPQKRNFPASYGFDRSRSNYRDKREAFTRMPSDKLTIVSVSQWIREEVRKSYLGRYNIVTIHNGIDTSVFRPDCGPLPPELQHLAGKKIVLGAASVWSREKGLDDLIELGKRLCDNYMVVLVGADLKKTYKNVTTVPRISDASKLARIYANATVFVNPTYQDNYPTVDLEAISCGTPVVVYDTGGCAEAINPSTGVVVRPGDINAVVSAVEEISQIPRKTVQKQCREYAVANFDKNKCFESYLNLYEKVTQK